MIANPGVALAPVLSYAPDFGNKPGHYAAYETHLAEALARKQRDMVTLANHTCPGHPDGSPQLLPLLRTETWRVGNVDEPSDAVVGNVSAELEFALNRCQELFGRDARLVLYAYMGSLQLIETVQELRARFPELRAVINLFWLNPAALGNDAFAKRCREAFRPVGDGSGLAVTVPLASTQKAVESSVGVRLPVAPHPSCTFGDRRVARTTPARSSPMRVLFPGSLRPEKGFGRVAETVALVRARAERAMTFSARSLVVAGTPAASRAALEELRGSVNLIEGELALDAFGDLFTNADLAVLPYSPDPFSWRTSGLVVDALMAATPCVVVAGTSLASIVEETGAGIVAASDQADDLAAAILRASTQLPALTDAAYRAREVYLKCNSWDALAGQILQLTQA